MKKLVSVILIVILVLSLCSCTGKQAQDVVILFTNDVHCGISDDIGYAGLAAYKQLLVDQGKQVSLVDCGDHIQGNYMALASKGQAVVEIMNAVGYDLATFGNHEFDYGIDGLNEVISKSNTQYLCCNLSYIGDGDNPLTGYKAYEVKTFGKIKVGFIGITTPSSLWESNPTNFKVNGEIAFDLGVSENAAKFYELIQNAVDACIKDGADYVVALSHCGVEEAIAPYRSIDFIANTTGIDVVLDGHSHTEMPCVLIKNKDNQDVLLSQTGTKLNNIGQLVISSDGFISVGFIADYEDKNEDIAKLIADIQATYDEELSKEITVLPYDLSIYDANGVRMVRNREVAIGDLVADAYRIGLGSDIGMINGGGVRASLNAGSVSFNDITSVNPFGNLLCVVKVQGSELLDMLEYFYRNVQKDYAKDGNAIGEDGSFEQISGLKLTINTSIPTSILVDENDALVSVGDTRRVSDVYVLQNGEYVPLEPNAIYTLTGTDYMIKDGGSGMGHMLADHEIVIDNAVLDYQMLSDYIISLNGDFSQYETVDDRITIK